MDFENYKLANWYIYGEPLKSWVTKENYHNVYLEDWNCLMDLVEVVNNYTNQSEKLKEILFSFNKAFVFEQCIKIMKEYEQNDLH